MKDHDQDPSPRLRVWGLSGPPIVALHGGPAAVGEAAPLAAGLSRSFRVWEPWQRGSGPEALTVERHVEDLARVVECCPSAPALVGESWGAMLALAYATAHPETVTAIVLVGCGTFDASARATLERTLAARTTPELRVRLDEIDRGCADPDARLAAFRLATEPLYGVDVRDDGVIREAIDSRAFTETWGDMLRLQREGVYPAAFASIEAPVLMLHGADDPHPGPAIFAGLQAHIPRIEYRQLDSCGHQPWRERAARREFFEVLVEWLTENAQDAD